MKREYQYYALPSGEYIPKSEVDKAFEIVAKLQYCSATSANIVTLDEAEVIKHGSKFDAIIAFHRKYDCGLVEAKEAIDFLRAEGRYE